MGIWLSKDITIKYAIGKPKVHENIQTELKYKGLFKLGHFQI